MKKVISLLIVCFILTACGKKIYENIDTNQALEIINDGAILLDVRTVDEYNREHIPNAINIPLDQIDSCRVVLVNKLGVRAHVIKLKLSRAQVY